MANPLSRFGVSDADLAKAIANSVEVDQGLQEESEKVAEYWRSVSPLDHGDYVASIRVQKKARHGKAQVGSKYWKAHLIEFGTKADPPDSKSPFGPNTPTPAFAPGQKTAEHFGGDLTGEGIEL